MAEGEVQERWNHTAALLALQANLHKDPKKGRTFKPADFHPMPPTVKPHERPPLKGDIRMLKQVFVDTQ